MSYWRARIGSISPSVCDAFHHDFYCMAPSRVLLVGVSCMIHGWRDEEYETGLAKVDECVRELSRREVQFIHHGGVPLVVAKGKGFEKELIERMEKIGKVPASTSVVSLMDALRHLGIKKLVVVDPYPDELHSKFIKYLEAFNFEVVHSACMRMPFYEVHKADMADVYNFAKETFAGAPGADGLCFACPQYPMLDAVERLEKEIGRPVVTPTLAYTWTCLRAVGVTDPKPGFGSLIESLREHRR